MSRSAKLVAPAALALASLLGGCTNGNIYDPHGYLSRSDAIDMSAGDANASNIAVQMVDPWPSYAGNKNIAYNGQRMQTAVERYRFDRVIPPQGMSPSGLYNQAPAQAPSLPNASAPIGQTVTQVK